MDEHRWSTAVRQGPVLLDEERNRICPEGLPLSTDISIRGRKERDSRLGLVRGKLVLSYASYMLADKQTQSPAFELLQCFRKAAGNPEADFSALREHLGQPVGYIDLEIDRRTVRPLDTFDVWKNMLLDSDGRWKEGREAVESAYPPLGAGRTAIDARAAESLSSYDGYIGGVVQEESGEESSMRTISASQLEGYAECPMRYYFQYVLRLRPKEAIEFDRSRWLQADERGSLLHRIFFLYLKQASASPPDLNHDRSLLEIVTNQVIEEYAERIPAPSRHVFDKECRDIRADVDVFYRKELESSTLPRYFELELSIEGGPMEVDLGDGLHIRMKGFVDRIDETAPHQYRIIDYKTGSPRDYRQNETFAGGTQLQHALYAVAAEQWLRQTGLDPQAEVREAAYYFPTQRGRGQEVVRIHNNRQELAVVVRRLLEAMDQGIYVPTQDPQTCAWCDYRIVCGHHAERMKEKRLVPENTALLEPLLEVEQHD
jgi:RecB family exonuclease